MPLDALIARIDALAGSSHRVIIGIAGSPGSGKTTLTTSLVERLGERAAHLPMDGFHLANRTLERLGRRERKGAIDTFDGHGFVALLERVRTETEHSVYAPSFRREVDEPVAGEIAIEPAARIVIVEGNYLLVEQDPWVRVRNLLDEAWFCETPGNVRERRLIERHTAGGRTVEAATEFARNVDGANAELIERTAHRADLRVSGITGESREKSVGGRETVRE